MTLTAPVYVPTPGYCMTGVYRGYNGDGGAAGQTKTQMDAITALTGQPVECVMISGSLSLSWGSTVFTSCTGCPQHLIVQLPLTAGNGLAATIAGTNDSLYSAIYTKLVAAGLNSKTKMTFVLGWEAGLGNFDWAPGKNSQTWAQYISAFQHVVTYVNGLGYVGGWAFDCGYGDGSDITNAAGALASYIDYFDNHPYNGIRNPFATPRDNVPLWIANDLQVVLDRVTAAAVTYNKLCMASEYGLEQPATGDTTSNTYVYHTIDTNLYYSFLQSYWAAHSDRWVAAACFMQNQPGSAPGVVVNEDNQMYYLGTDPKTMPTANLRNTNGTGPAYFTPSPHHSLSLPDWLSTVAVAGSMQLQPAVPASSSPTQAADYDRRGQSFLLTY